MALIGKIITLFADKEKTLPQFPRTKINAVSDNDGIGLDAILDELSADVDNTKQIANNAMLKANFSFDSSTGTLNITL